MHEINDVGAIWRSAFGLHSLSLFALEGVCQWGISVVATGLLPSLGAKPGTKVPGYLRDVPRGSFLVAEGNLGMRKRRDRFRLIFSEAVELILREA